MNHSGNAGCDDECTTFYKSLAEVRPDHVPIIYSSKYNICLFGVEKLHPFDSSKYKHVVKDLIKSGIITEGQFIEPLRHLTEEELRVVHTKEYLDCLKLSHNVSVITEVGLCGLMPSSLVWSRVLTPMLYGTAGSIIAGKVALDRGWAINLSGGFHHACAYQGGGFCVYSDITLSLRHLRKHCPGVKEVMIIDLDAHQGNGYARDKRESNDTDLFIVDIYNSQIYPHDAPAKTAIDLACEVVSGTRDDVYLHTVERALNQAFERFTPQIVYYNAGTDVLQGDPLGQMDISAKAIIRRDEMVFQAATQRNIPIVMLLSGGYHKSSAQVISSSIQNILRTILHLTFRKLDSSSEFQRH